MKKVIFFDLPRMLGQGKKLHKVDKPITTLICNMNILGPTPRGLHIFLEVCACFMNQILVEF